jgi:hypothetical protein
VMEARRFFARHREHLSYALRKIVPVHRPLAFECPLRVTRWIPPRSPGLHARIVHAPGTLRSL